jgi:hypothetical protein
MNIVRYRRLRRAMAVTDGVSSLSGDLSPADHAALQAALASQSADL